MSDSQSWFDQAVYDIRCEWGQQGVTRLAPISDAVIIVDVLSFSTSVCIAVERGALVYPYAGPRKRLAHFAAARNAVVADRRGTASKYSLAPHSLVSISSGTRLVLPSPNGSTLSTQTGLTPTLVGCLRNATAVAEAALRFGRRIAIVPAGERWREDGSLRPSFEDLVGSGAIASHLPGTHSPEVQAAIAAYEQSRHDLQRLLRECGSGRELLGRGSGHDVELAADLDSSRCAPVLRAGAYQATV